MIKIKKIKKIIKIYLTLIIILIISMIKEKHIPPLYQRIKNINSPKRMFTYITQIII